ncbi:hypothetical protein SRABI26_02719 [Arthrobacter sp. Bi26]|uniref:VG15 protein n=1 Tax=Arthrobacter sp. Bi26 TaxID=2822350 RepID=UPI001E102F70|nr:hypothetical protein [Arthrobacter sp. Bi26]CAH0233764.1 hypothetical protein SRABI26_02719 [Arthrobacter sp. Bi26]
MVVRDDLERFRAANAGLSKLVIAELEGFFYALDLSKPEAVRDALIEFVPLLVGEYGPVAADLAVDWYEEQRAAAGALGRFQVKPAQLILPAGDIEKAVRYSAGHLFTPDPAQTLSTLSVNVDKLVKQHGRDTMSRNAEREGVRWARVPSGSKTCAFCLTLASRDVVYLTEKSALRRSSDGKKYHGFCDCVPTRIASIDDYPDGYDPDGMYQMYQDARGESGSGDIKDIAFALRRLFPGSLTDGVESL